MSDYKVMEYLDRDGDVANLMQRAIVLVGGYGCGKTEIAVNMALRLADKEQSVTLLDLDIANPYFRSREARHVLERHGVRVVSPGGDADFSDLPIISPLVKGAIDAPQGITIADVGGDENGAKVLASIGAFSGSRALHVWHVINSRRPFCETVEDCLMMQHRLEEVSGIAVTGLLVNTHLLHETRIKEIEEGAAIGMALSKKAKIPLVFQSLMFNVKGAAAFFENQDFPPFWLRRNMVPPWGGNGEKNGTCR